ncbi:protein phosphatase [Jannaschia sp. LMIT008]|uniref:protein-tyrosine phosphatase family protein n=1 Tax=Jannaschia maritima TaxID=3032585 RepID=UPI002810F53C|nr:protein phosphatase [Jannaschia sp. LMIT008]
MSFPIATVAVPPGRIGVAPLPRDEGTVDAIVDWGAALVLSMTEAAEMPPGLGARIAGRGIAWRHLPVRDFGGPDGATAAAWPGAEAACLSVLRTGGGVLVHCRGGQGRSGMVALRLMVAMGESPDVALRRLRAVRPGAVETDAQRRWAAG